MQWRRRAPLALTALGLTAIVAGGIWLLAGGGGADTRADPLSPTVAPGGEKAFIATPTPGPIEVRWIDDAPFPPATSMLLLRLPQGHGSGVMRLDRVYRLASGPVREGAAANSDGSVIWISICYGEGCVLVGGDAPGDETAFLRSLDGGLTWTEEYRRRGEWAITQVAGDEATAARIGSDEPPAWIVVPSGEALFEPEGAAREPIVVGGEIAWLDSSHPRIQTRDGGTLAKTAAAIDTAPAGAIIGLLAEPGRPWLVSWPQELWLVTPVRQSEFREDVALSVPMGFSPAGWLDDSIVLGHASPGYELDCGERHRQFEYAPAILDLGQGALDGPAPNPTLAYLGDELLNGCESLSAARVLQVSRVPFALVATGGDCLEVRGKPNIEAEPIGCFADGVLLTLREGDGPHEDGEHTWLGATTPAREGGYADAGFLVRD